MLGLHCSARASHCACFSCCRARALGVWASGVVALGLSWPTVHGIFWGLGIEPMSSVLAGRFLTTGPPEIPSSSLNFYTWTDSASPDIPHPVFSSPVWDDWFPAWIGSSLPWTTGGLCSGGGQLSYCARLKDDYGMVPRQYARPPDKPPISASSMEPGLPSSAAVPCPHPLTPGHNPSPLLACGSLL